MYEVWIQNGVTAMLPVVEGEVRVTWSRGFQAGKLEFNAVKDEGLSYQEGNPVALKKDGRTLFFGYVFEKARDKKQIIRTTAFDQLRYLKNKDSYQYEKKTYGELLSMICADRHLKTGAIAGTGYQIPFRTERDKEFFQILQWASDATIVHTGTEYVLFDRAGEVCLQPWSALQVSEAVTYDTAENFDYRTTIDGSYNRVKLSYVDDKKKKLTPVIAEDTGRIGEWGLLQYYQETTNREDLQGRAKGLLELLNRKGRTLTIQNAVGNWDVRAGSLIPVLFGGFSDIVLNSWMLVDEVVHKVKEGHHFMDLRVLNKDVTGGIES